MGASIFFFFFKIFWLKIACKLAVMVLRGVCVG